MSPKRANGGRNEDQPTPSPIPEDPLNKQVSHAKFRVAFTLLAQYMSSQNNQQVVTLANVGENTTTTRIWDFTQMNPSVFFGSKLEEDLPEFLDSVQKVTEIMGFILSKSIDLAVY